MPCCVLSTAPTLHQWYRRHLAVVTEPGAKLELHWLPHYCQLGQSGCTEERLGVQVRLHVLAP